MSTQTPRTWLGLIGTLVVLLVFTFSSGVQGLVVGGLIAVSWWVLPSMYAFVIGQFGLLVLAADASGLVVIAGGELGLIAILIQATVTTPRPGQVLAIAVGAVGAATLLSWMSYEWLASIVGVGGLVVGVGAIVAYWVHRYEQVTLDRPADTAIYE